MPIQTGKDIAIERALSVLENTDLNNRLLLHGFEPFSGGLSNIRLFGENAVFCEKDYSLKAETGNEIKINRYILFLHYLLNDFPAKRTGNIITFRQLKGGQFYWEPFIQKTIKPLINIIGNDIKKLEKGLEIFDCEKDNRKDYSVFISVIGKTGINLVYRVGDEEFPPDADIFFDASVANIFNTEDISVLCSEVCFGIINKIRNG